MSEAKFVATVKQNIGVQEFGLVSEQHKLMGKKWSCDALMN